MNNKRLLVRTLCLIALLLLVAGVGRCVSLAWSGEMQETTRALGRFFHMMQIVRRNYVDSDKTRPSKLIDAALDGMVSSLDEWSEYLLPEDVKMWEEEGAGSYGGIGITFTQENNHFIITEVFEDSPAMKAGMISKDEVIAIDGKKLDKEDFDNGFLRIRGKVGTSVSLTVLRGGKELTMEMERAIIQIPMLRNQCILEGDIGFVRLLQFSDTTIEPFEKALKDFEGKGVRGMILDLRDNPGGNVDSAIDVCSRFLPEGSVVVTLKERDGRGGVTYKSKKEYCFPMEIPLVILINGESASSSEITAGCLKDHGRATLVGTRSFGKGVAQSFFTLKDGTGLKLTTSRFYTPNPERGSIHGNGIQPDVEVKISKETEKEIKEMHTSEQKFNPSRDPQIMKAIEIIRENLNP